MPACITGRHVDRSIICSGLDAGLQALRGIGIDAVGISARAATASAIRAFSRLLRGHRWR